MRLKRRYEVWNYGERGDVGDGGGGGGGRGASMFVPAFVGVWAIGYR